MAGLIAVVGIGLLAPPPAVADSAIDLLSGFDIARIDNVYPATSPTAVEDLAKLLYRLDRLDQQVLSGRVGERSELGDAVAVSGVVTARRVIAVPSALREVLEFDTITELLLAPVSAPVSGPAAAAQPLADSMRLFAVDVPAQLQPGDRVGGVGVVIDSVDQASSATAEHADASSVVAMSRVSWTPADPAHHGWRLLADAGFDLALLSGVVGRDGQRLTAADADSFFTMLAAADRIANGEVVVDPPLRVEPVQLLTKSTQFTGRWIRIRVETVRVTRISLEDQPLRRKQLGRDHYYQIDGIGDLGNVQIQIVSALGDEEPITLQNRYPVSIVAAELPEFMRARLAAEAGPNAIVAPLRMSITVDGFFLRLWRYESELMNRQRDGEQLGPLLVAARIFARESQRADPAGVGKLGWAAAAAVIATILAVVVWASINARRDRNIKRTRKRAEQGRLSWPVDDSRH